MEHKRERKERQDRTLELATTSTSLASQLKDSGNRTPCLVVMRGLDVGNVIRLERPVLVAGRDDECELVFTDEGVSRRHARFVSQGKGYFIEDLGSTNGIFVNGTAVESALLSEGDKILLGRFTVLKYTQQDELELEFQRSIHESASLDGLTGALNRRCLDVRLEAEFSYARRHKTEVSLIMFDLDRFKRINDTYGHAAGDEVLRMLADAVRETLRMEDLFGRYGGEEFVVALRGVGHAGTMGLAERLRQVVASLQVKDRGEQIPVTISLGVATIRRDSSETLSDLVSRADKRLYQAKEGGRNQIIGS